LVSRARFGDPGLVTACRAAFDCREVARGSFEMAIHGVLSFAGSAGQLRRCGWCATPWATALNPLCSDPEAWSGAGFPPRSQRPLTISPLSPPLNDDGREPFRHAVAALRAGELVLAGYCRSFTRRPHLADPLPRGERPGPGSASTPRRWTWRAAASSIAASWRRCTRSCLLRPRVPY
jgi:hypothetical protein